MAQQLRSKIKVTNVFEGIEGRTFYVTVRAPERDGIKLEIRISMLGECASGKSTFVRALEYRSESL